ncbi:hypothetical protein MNEG_5272 [Monoraphidium neglectum]|uniref:Uncharacterized protein n=1 Tax=Monoraphidium neglectum TaxID=145388 RepID=A0A0D2MI46_9CHLO|nr:hypothetical protein MNEG_5272 [Monoraphidium neglectum]KIZ02685.1 hypothetical protein MNEG_5272 [Monoraphidium neglectum]|eukprot:XP_013901704.1 hypothetical protein MNEG_5272 [Monoraphidium neglectum]
MTGDDLQRLLEAFGLTSLADARWFTRHDMRRLGTAARVGALLDAGLAECWMPCKRHYTQTPLNEQRALTVLRQALRPHCCHVHAKEFSLGARGTGVKYRVVGPETRVARVTFSRQPTVLNLA